MNQEKIGQFISSLRKEKNITQEELAEKLGVSNKTISRWENGKCMPDLSLLIPISDYFEISVTELLSGEKLEKNDYNKKLEENVIINLNFIKKKTIKKIFRMIYLCIMAILILIGSLVVIYVTGNYILSKEVKIKKEDLTYNICNKDNKYIVFSMEHKDGYGISIKDQVKEGINKFTAARTIRGNIDHDSIDFMSGDVLIKLNGETDLKEIYFYDELIWKQGIDLPDCEQ